MTIGEESFENWSKSWGGFLEDYLGKDENGTSYLQNTADAMQKLADLITPESGSCSTDEKVKQDLYFGMQYLGISIDGYACERCPDAAHGPIMDVKRHLYGAMETAWNKEGLALVQENENDLESRLYNELTDQQIKKLEPRIALSALYLIDGLLFNYKRLNKESGAKEGSESPQDYNLSSDRSKELRKLYP